MRDRPDEHLGLCEVRATRRVDTRHGAEVEVARHPDEPGDLLADREHALTLRRVPLPALVLGEAERRPGGDWHPRAHDLNTACDAPC